MSIRYKFRSSVNFEAVEIGNRSSISVKELRANIIHSQKQQGFDLIFSDAVSGLEYKGDDAQIPSGSSVIVKRVPGGTVPSAASPVPAVKDFKEPHNLIPANGPVDEFDDFGADLCTIPDSSFPHFSLEFDTQNSRLNKKEDIAGLRLEDQKFDTSDLSQAIPRGPNQSGNERNISPRVHEQMKLKKLSTSNFLAVQSTNLPLELKCSCCNSFFKEAVMIPCCQHSFCDKCIRIELTEKGSCPKCFSSRCKVEDLLPNLSLRQAIEHFLESQMLDAGLENAMEKYVPDGESCIQAKEVSCALSVVLRKTRVPQPSSATGKGSNQISMDEQHQKNVPCGNSDFQGENHPVFTQANVRSGADFSSRRKGGYWTGTGGDDRNSFGLGGHRKVVRNCYTCGSPDHLMRDCPISNPDPMFHSGSGAFDGNIPGYAQPYWNASSLPSFRTYANMYGNPAMTPFNASMVPVSPFALAPYIPPMCGGMPDPSGNMRMGDIGPPRHPEYFGLQRCANTKNHPNEDLEREQHSNGKDDSLERHRYKSPEKSHDYRMKDKEPSLSHSGDSFVRRSGRKSHNDKIVESYIHHVYERHEKSLRSSFAEKDKRPHNAERSNSGRSSDWHSEGRHKHHHERRGHYDSDSSLGHHSSQKDVKRRVESDVRGSHRRHHSFSESGYEPCSPPHHKGGYKERETGYDSKHASHSAKRSRDKRHDEGPRDDYRYHKRRAY